MIASSGVNSIVIGGGIAGLVAARQLALKGDSVTLLEASGRVGGLISSVVLLGVPVDSGAEAFAVARPQTLDLIEQLGLGSKVVRPARSDARIRIGEKTIPIPAGILGIPADLDDPAFELAVGAEAVSEAKSLDSKAWMIAGSPTIGEVVEARLGRATLENLVAPVIGGVHASDPMKLEMRVVAPGLLEAAAAAGSLVLGVAALRGKAAAPGSAVAGFEGGMHKLIGFLVQELENLGVEIRLNSAVLKVDITENAFEVMVGGAPRLDSDRLILAVPPNVAAELLRDKPQVAGPLEAIRAVDVAVVALALESPKLDSEPLGSGVLVAEGHSNILAKGSTHTTAKWHWLKTAFEPGVHILRLSYGRDGVIPVAQGELVATAVRDAELLYGLSGSTLVDSAVINWPQALIQSAPGHQELLLKLGTAAAGIAGLGIVGAGLGGNGITGIIAKTLETTSQIGVRYSHGD
jgi:oxygen-dependent protoporphyrinogen oxidase